MSSYTKWMPAELAARLNCLQRGANVKANTAATVAYIMATAKTNAAGAATYAKYDTATGRLKILPALFPNFVKPIAS